MHKQYRPKPDYKQRSNDRLNARGQEVLDNERPVDEYVMRPPTLAQQIQRLNAAGETVRQFYYHEGLDEEDFMEYLDELPDEGITEYEKAALTDDEPVKKAVKGFFKSKKEKAEDEAAKSSSPAPGASQTVEGAGEGGA